MNLYQALAIMNVSLDEINRMNTFDLIAIYNEISEENNYDDETLADAYELLLEAIVNKDKTKTPSVKKKIIDITYPSLNTRKVSDLYEAHFDRTQFKNYKEDEITKERVTSIQDKKEDKVIPIILPYRKMTEQNISIVKSYGKLYLVSLIGIGKC